ncbi:MAG: MotA/TolQ/ExbB proton channel family, partial [Candidatus Hydrogenedentota bacterium]
MMQAFVVISTDIAQVQGMSMAAGVAKAMITTAAGLALAIPCMVVYYYLRGRVTRIIATLESQANEFIELIIEKGGRA